MNPNTSETANSGADQQGKKEFKTMNIGDLTNKKQASPANFGQPTNFGMNAYPSFGMYSMPMAPQMPFYNMMPQPAPVKQQSSSHSRKLVQVPMIQLDDYKDITKVREKFECLKDLHNPKFKVDSIKEAEFFILRSTNDDDLHKAIKYGMWTSSYRNNTTLQHTYSNSIRKDGSRIPVYIFYTVVNSEQFTGVAQMTSDVEFAKSFNYWWEDGKWTGVTKIKWVYIKDAPHNLFNHVIEGDKPVTVLRDGTRLSYETGLKMLRVFENLPTGNSEDIFDAFPFMDDREEKMRLQRDFVGTNPDNNKPYQSSGNKHYKSDNQYYKGPKPTSSYKGGQGGNNGYVSKYPYKKDFQKGSKDYQYEKESDQKNEDGNFGIVIQKKSTKSKKGRANGKADEQEPKQDSKGEAKDNIVEVPPSED